MLLSHALRTVSPSAVVTYIGAVQDTNNLTSYTFTNVNIGTASNDRIVVVGIGSVSVSAGSVSSVTIGGNTATINTQASGGQTCVVSLLVTSGTTATIVVNYTAGRGNCTIYVWTITKAKSIAAKSADSQSNTTSNPSITLNGEAGAVGCAVTFVSNTGTSSFTWAGMTENADQTAETRRVSAASGLLNSSLNTVTATNSIANATVFLSGASWR